MRDTLGALLKVLRPPAPPRRPRSESTTATYRIDELARAAGTTVRNVRLYQERTLLPPPRREGRVGWYSSAHLARLRTIGALLERGYSLANIGELVGAWEGGRDLAGLIGLEAAVTSPFEDEAATTTTPDEIARLLGAHDEHVLERAIEVGLIEEHEGMLRVPSPKLLRAGVELYNAGIPADALLAELGSLRKDVDAIAARLVALVEKHLFDRHGDGLPPRDQLPALAGLVWRLRPLAGAVVASVLARSLERHVRGRLGERIAKAAGR